MKKLFLSTPFLFLPHIAWACINSEWTCDGTTWMCRWRDLHYPGIFEYLFIGLIIVGFLFTIIYGALVLAEREKKDKNV